MIEFPTMTERGVAGTNQEQKNVGKCGQISTVSSLSSASVYHQSNSPGSARTLASPTPIST